MLEKLHKLLVEAYLSKLYSAQDIVICLSHIVNRCSLRVVDMVGARSEDDEDQEYDENGNPIDMPPLEDADDDDDDDEDDDDEDDDEEDDEEDDEDDEEDDEDGDEQGDGTAGNGGDGGDGDEDDGDGTGNIIKLVRRTVRAIRASPQRRDAWEETIVDVNTRNHTNMQPLQLILDVRTRWDSTYLMIKCFLLMREVRSQRHSL